MVTSDDSPVISGRSERSAFFRSSVGTSSPRPLSIAAFTPVALAAAYKLWSTRTIEYFHVYSVISSNISTTEGDI